MAVIDRTGVGIHLTVIFGIEAISIQKTIEKNISLAGQVFYEGKQQEFLWAGSVEGGAQVISEIELIFRLTLAFFLGGLIGYERQARHKSAGLKTNALVCLGSCLIMILSYYIYQRVEGMTNADPARLAAQVVSGIGFLGAGTIMKEGLTVRGLTTAACLWVVSGVGLAVGCGYYMGALLTSVLVFITLRMLSRIDRLYDRNLEIVIETDESMGRITGISKALEEMNIEITSISVREKEQDRIEIYMVVYNHDIRDSMKVIERLRMVRGVAHVHVHV